MSAVTPSSTEESVPHQDSSFSVFAFQPSRGSALVGWVGKDTKRLVAMLQTKERILS
jgi:hypothetical protein